jgi:hypothetical protein
MLYDMLTYFDYYTDAEDLTEEYNAIMLIIENFDAAFRHTKLNKDINLCLENGDFHIVDELSTQLEAIDIDDTMIQKCFAFAENNKVLLDKLQMFENKLKLHCAKLFREKNKISYNKHREYMKDISNKIVNCNQKASGLVET